jgi:pilus assembly protein CpaF
MSLMERVERAQRAKAAAEAASSDAASERPASGSDPTPTDPVPSSTATESGGVATAIDIAIADHDAPIDGSATNGSATNGSATNGTTLDDGVIRSTTWTAYDPAIAPDQSGADPVPVMAVVPVPPPTRVSSSGGLRAPKSPAREDLLREVRLRLQREVVGAFKALLEAKDGEVRGTIEPMVDRVVEQGGFAVTREERTRLVDEMVHEVTGFGPLEPLLADPTITEVMVNGPDHIYIERRGKIERIDSVFLNDQHVHRVIERIIAPLGRRIDESSPRVDARLPDGSRVNAIIEPLSLSGPVITVRKFAQTPYTVDDLVSFGTATPDMFEFLHACIEARLNLFVSGGTGSGKTTTLNVLSSFIPNDERIVTIEDAAELQLRQDHVITLESRPPNLEGEGEITIRNLLRNAMHMRPDRVIVGECRAGEALDMLQAMTTGHDGSLSTGHANTPKDMLRRLETMVLMTGYRLPLRAIREQIASAVDVIVHTARLKDGQRKIVNITEVYGIEEEEILTQDIFTFVQTGYHDGKIEGSLQPTGIRPTFMSQFKRAGIELPADEYGIPPADPDNPIRPLKSRFGAKTSSKIEFSPIPTGDGRTVVAGGTVYISSIGPVDPETGEVALGSIKEQTRRCMANLKERLDGAGSRLDNVVWANWSLHDPADFDEFNDEWNRWFPADPPMGQLTIMAPLQRRAGFGVSIGVIATI